VTWRPQVVARIVDITRELASPLNVRDIAVETFPPSGAITWSGGQGLFQHGERGG
jgi:hypothetical protein